MSAMAPAAAPELSIVVPVVERAGDLLAIYRQLVELARLSGRRSEVLFVVDRRQEQVLPALRGLEEEEGVAIVLLVLAGSFGESAAITLGIAQARGDLVATVPAYLQVSPLALLPALAWIEEGADLVVARREPRLDSRFNRLQSWAFHHLLRALTRSPFHDTSCGLRLMRRQVAREVQLYGGLHRFLPVLAARRGFVVRELATPQLREDGALRYHGLSLYLKRLIDLVTVFFLLDFTHRPLRFFGVVGFALAGSGLAICGVLAGQRLLGLGTLADRPLLLLGVLLVVLGSQSVSLGLLGEIVIFTHARRLRDFHVAEVVRRPVPAAQPGVLRRLRHRAS